MIGPFSLVVQHNEDSSFEFCSCSCGWRLGCDGVTDAEAVEACELHNIEHKNYVKALAIYNEGKLFYHEAISFLVMLGMEEERAERLLDEGI